MTTIYEARKVVTMNPSRPLATHVAVREGRILGAGSLDELTGWGAYKLDRTFADKVLMPGLVEGHSHVAEGVQWRFVYCGYFDRTDPDGTTWPGLRSIEEVLARLSAANVGLSDPKQPLTGWALDPIYFDNRRITREDLDRVTTTRPIGIMHASGHIMNVNTRALELAGLLRAGINHPGVPLGSDGLPTGEMKGPEAMTPLGPHVGLDRSLLASDEPGLRAFARLCVRKGVTTAADLANLLPQPAVDMMLRVSGEGSFPARIVSLRIARDISPAELIDRVIESRPTACGTWRRSSCARSSSALWRPVSRFTAIPMAIRRRSSFSTRWNRPFARARRRIIALPFSTVSWRMPRSFAACVRSACASICFPTTISTGAISILP
jgi:predicted amidohydrolase YtcJ